MKQLTEDDVEGMSPAQIVKAQESGHLDEFLGRTRKRPPSEGQLTDADLETMTPAEVVEAQSTGRLDELMGKVQK